MRLPATGRPAPAVDMSHFPSAKHSASWVGVCPDNRESGGKRLSGKARTGNAWFLDPSEGVGKGRVERG